MRLRSANLRSQGPAKAADAPARPSLGSAAAPPPTTEPSCNGSSSEAELAAPTPEAPSSRRAKGAKRRLPPVDIGIQELLLGRGMVVAGGKEGLVEAVDRAPLGRVGFTPQTLQAACDFLAKADHKLAPLIEALGPPERLLAKKGSNFATLAKAICFQQLATTAAAKIYERVLIACSCTDLLSPAAVLGAPVPDLRAAGLSERKVQYLQDLAQHFSDGRLSDAKIEAMDEEQLEAALTAVRGIGVWTVHMHAMFHTGAPDVLPTGDLGVRKGMQQLYGLRDLPDAAKMHSIAEKWRPFASLGSYYMWKVEVPHSASGSKEKKAKKV